MEKFTKIVATIGPACDSIEMIEKLYNAGMNVARLNFSHGDYDYFEKVIKNIRKVSDKIAILLDTKGPEIRTGEVKGGEYVLNDHDTILLTNKKVIFDGKILTINYDNLMDLSKGNKILIDDGLIEGEIIGKEGDYLKLKILNGGVLGSKKTVSIWGHDVEMNFLSEKDIKDIEFGIKNNLDFIAASFVRKKEEVLMIRKIVDKYNSNIKIISKIEHSKSVENIDEILEVSDGIMVARGDLGVEIPLEKVPKVQLEIIRKCREAAKPVIIATQMLESMKNNPRPTRAEVNDVANAILQGTDAVMLSGETASGKYPIKAVRIMSKIAREYEKEKKIGDLEENKLLDFKSDKINMFISKSAYLASEFFKSAKVIVTPTISGHTPRQVSRFRPHKPILAITHDKTVARQLNLSYGVITCYEKNDFKKIKDMFKKIKLSSEKFGYLKDDEDIAIVTFGFKLGIKGMTNTLEIFRKKDLEK
jgi:pyruvate kinase